MVGQEQRWGMEENGWCPWWENGFGGVGNWRPQGNAPHLLAEHKMNFLYRSAVALVFCEKRQPLRSGNLSESWREDVSLTLRKICYLLWTTKDAFKMQTIGSRELVSSLAGLDWEGDLQWIYTVKHTNALVWQPLLFPPCLWSVVYRLSGICASGSFLLLSLPYPCFYLLLSVNR